MIIRSNSTAFVLKMESTPLYSVNYLENNFSKHFDIWKSKFEGAVFKLFKFVYWIIEIHGFEDLKAKVTWTF